MRQHGTHVRYVQGPNEFDAKGVGCRCDPCRAANRDYERRRQQRIEPPYVSAGPARAHLEWLADNGIGIKSIARVAGVSHGCLSKLVHGDYGRKRPPSRRIKPETAEKILAVTPSRFVDGTREPAGPVLELVARLIAAGVPKVRIAERLGQKGTGLQLGQQLITRRNAAAVRQMAAELDAGTLVTIKHHRNGDRVIAPPGSVTPPDQLREALEDRDKLYLELAEILEQRIDDAEWHATAACRGRPAWMFFPARGDIIAIRAARKVCAACIVRGRCLEANLDQPDGIFAGTSPMQRRKLRADRDRAA